MPTTATTRPPARRSARPSARPRTQPRALPGARTCRARARRRLVERAARRRPRRRRSPRSEGGGAGRRRRACSSCPCSAPLSLQCPSPVCSNVLLFHLCGSARARACELARQLEPRVELPAPSSRRLPPPLALPPRRPQELQRSYTCSSTHSHPPWPPLGGPLVQPPPHHPPAFRLSSGTLLAAPPCSPPPRSVCTSAFGVQPTDRRSRRRRSGLSSVRRSPVRVSRRSPTRRRT